jgi:hypothetical protein
MNNRQDLALGKKHGFCLPRAAWREGLQVSFALDDFSPEGQGLVAVV